MESKDGKHGFDFAGIYTDIEPNRVLKYSLGDRNVEITFTENDGSIEITIIFDAEEINPLEMQQMGWQAILDNFKKYVEKNI